jgi:uncharacterized membrane protein YGL010W
MEAAMSSALRSYFAEYAAFHGTRGNQACHYAAIPVIVLSIFALLARVPVLPLGGFTLTLAEVVIVLSTVYYLTLDARLALLMLVASLGLDALGRFLPPALALGLFVLGWVIQFVGHYVYEKKSPAFYRNVVHLLVGPLWILAKATGRA